MNETKKNNGFISYLIKAHLLGKVLAGLLIVAVIVAVIFGAKKVVFSIISTVSVALTGVAVEISPSATI